jgi:hypothetical protein
MYQTQTGKYQTKFWPLRANTRSSNGFQPKITSCLARAHVRRNGSLGTG